MTDNCIYMYINHPILSQNTSKYCPHKVRKCTKKNAQSEIYCKIYKARTKCETHKVKPHKVRANCSPKLAGAKAPT